MRLASTILLLALGATSALAQTNAIVITDQSDYAPGSTATITGAGFQAGETVQLQVLRIDIDENSGPEHDPWTVLADGDGNFQTTWYVTYDEANSTLQLTATGLSSGLVAQEIFTDKNAPSGQGTSIPTPNTATAASTGNSIAFAFTWTDSYQSGSQATMLVPAGWSAPQTASSSSAGYLTTSGGNASINSISGSGPWTIIVDFSGNTGQAFTLTYANVTAPTLAGSYSFDAKTKATSGGTLTALIGGSATITVSPVTASAYKITAASATPTAGASDALTITLVDQYGNTVTSFSGDKTLTFSGLGNAPGGNVPTLTSKTGSAVNQGTSELITFTSGVSSAGGSLIAYKAEGPVTLNLTDSGSLSSTSTGGSGVSLTVSGATANHLAFSTSPAGAVHKTAFTTQPIVKTRDTYGNNSIGGIGATVTVNLTLSTGTGPLAGTTSSNIGTSGGNGTATFSGLQVNKAENGDVLTAAATSFTSGTSAAFNITAATVTISSGITTNNKTYNATTAATISSNSVVLSGVLSGDTANVALSTNGYTATFASAAKANGVTVTVSGLTLTGTAAGNYTLTAPAGLAANITAATVTISSGITTNNKTYNATTAATISSNSVVLSGVLSGDAANVALSTNGYTATFASAAKANGVTVTVSGLSLTGTAAGNYTLTAPSLSANVMAASTTSAVTSSANPALPGTSVMFTGTLSVTAPGGGTPTGSVSFKDGASVLGPGTLNGSGVATLSTSSLSHGNHVITAEYAGDGNFLGSTNRLGTNQVINTAPVASLATYTRSSGLSWKILITSLLTNSTSDADGDARTLTAVGSSTNGATITKSGTWIFYVPPPASNVNSNATDYFSYTISDGFAGGTNSGMIRMAVTDPSIGSGCLKK